MDKRTHIERVSVRKYARIFVVIAGSLLSSCANTFSQNVAKNATLSVSPAPNYTLTKDKSRKEMLVDGQYSNILFFWKDPGTLGWQNVNQVTIDFSFDTPVSVAAVKLHTVTGQKAEVNMPLSVLVFMSNDQQHWQYIGDMMDNQSAKDEYYKIIPLSLDGIHATGKYVRVLAIPNGSYLFTDEIQILAGDSNVASRSANYKAVNTSDLPGFVKQCRDASIGQRFSKEEKSAAVAKSAPLSAMAVAAPNNTGVTMTQLASPFATALQPVSTTTPIETFKGLSDYTGWVISNGTGKSTSVTLSFTAGSPDLSVHTYWAKPVKSRDFKVVPDALAELKSGAAFDLAANETKVILMKTQAGNAGNYKVSLNLQGQGINVSKQLSVNAGSPSLAAFTNLKPDVNVWAYFNYPLLAGRQASTRQDLLNHYVNTFVIPPGILLPNLPVDKNEKLKAYLQNMKGFDQVLLYLDFSVNGKSDFLSDAWKQSFLKWYDDILKVIVSGGVSANRVYLYPFDEVKPTQVNAFKQFSDWIKSVRKGTPIFATISNAGTLNTIGQNIDISQVFYNNKIIRENQESRSSRGKTWLYDIKKPTKSLSPYGYYRLMAWKAYAAGITGIGFWQYGDVGHEANATSVWDDFDGKSADFAVIYDDGNQVLSSRRWEAFKVGVEDYMLLSAYAKKTGASAAMELCRSVLANEDKTSQADDARKKIIKALEN
ncbi:hypothetical protein [Chitinophaga sp.]|uniref:hypothetical protein n=1 Tax=Chitinophaga sp. TaxID=1869181 RepID=UPI002F92E008